MEDGFLEIASSYESSDGGSSEPFDHHLGGPIAHAQELQNSHHAAHSIEIPAGWLSDLRIALGHEEQELILTQRALQ